MIDQTVTLSSGKKAKILKPFIVKHSKSQYYLAEVENSIKVIYFLNSNWEESTLFKYG